MKKQLLLTSMLTLGLALASCSSEEAFMPDQNLMVKKQRTVSFNLKMPSGDKLNFSRADGDGNPIHDISECEIKTLTLYEYEVNAADQSETLKRIIKSGGSEKNQIDLEKANSGTGNYSFSITVPDEYMDRQFKYRFVANDATADPALNSPFESIPSTGEEDDEAIAGLKSQKATRVLKDEDTADVLATGGITMSGTAKVGTDEIITIKEGLKCKVDMERIISRIDIRYSTPNLRITGVKLINAPKDGYLFARTQNDGTVITPSFTDTDCVTLGLNATADLPDDFLIKTGKETFEMKKAFYLYERTNEAGNTAIVHIDYLIDYNDKVDSEGNKIYYHGSLDVEFAGKDGYINAQRNHRYTIVLGDGNKPVAGELKATIHVNDWLDAAIEDYLTSDDEVIED